MSEVQNVHFERDTVLGGCAVHVRDLPTNAIVPLKLSKIEAEIFSAWEDVEVGFGFGFSEAAKRSGVEEHRIRRAVRALARKGALEFCRTLFDENDGEMCGAGYVLTEAGRAHIATTPKGELACS